MIEINIAISMLLILSLLGNLVQALQYAALERKLDLAKKRIRNYSMSILIEREGRRHEKE